MVYIEYVGFQESFCSETWEKVCMSICSDISGNKFLVIWDIFF